MQLSSNDDLGQLVKCMNFAAIKHKSQRRKDLSQTPYINHPIGVANLLVEGGITDLVTLQAALLHDTVEDTNTTFEEISAEFGEEVCSVVREVTDDKSLPYQRRKELQILNASNSSHRAKLVKLADKLYNLRDLQKSPPVGWTSDRINQYFNWSYKVVSQLQGTNAYLEENLNNIFIKKKIKRSA
ncbi:hypothetical protein Avbf_10333 [Armadillidium vulgare]|nr:hypothetical protein Avbf_10333 [Armadillidium vulgare]